MENNKLEDCKKLKEYLANAKSGLEKIDELLASSEIAFAGPAKNSLDFFIAEIKKLLDCYKEISFIEYTTLAELDKNDFHSTESFKANISQQIILAMLNGYAEGRYHAGNSNYIEDKESDKIIGISYNARGFKDPEKDFAGFAEYIKKNIRLIPSDLRDHFTIHIGHNFGDACGILIKGDEIKIIDQDVINDQGMTIGNKGITYYDYNNEQLKKIYKKVTEELSK